MAKKSKSKTPQASGLEEYRLTSGKFHYAIENGETKCFRKGDVIKLTELQAAKFADLLEPAQAAEDRLAIVVKAAKVKMKAEKASRKAYQDSVEAFVETEPSEENEGAPEETDEVSEVVDTETDPSTDSFVESSDESSTTSEPAAETTEVTETSEAT